MAIVGVETLRYKETLVMLEMADRGALEDYLIVPGLRSNCFLVDVLKIVVVYIPFFCHFAMEIFYYRLKRIL